MDLSKSQVDYLAAGSHKWLMGTTGAAILYISPQRIKQLRPVLAGWLSHEQPLDFLFEPDQLRYDRPIRAQADAVESGTQPDIALAALQCSTQALLDLGVESAFAHVQEYHDRLEQGLLERGYESLRGPRGARSGILSLRHPRGLTGLVAALGEGGIVTTAPDGCLRIAPHWANDLAEVERVLEGFDKFLRA